MKCKKVFCYELNYFSLIYPVIVCQACCWPFNEKKGRLIRMQNFIWLKQYNHKLLVTVKSSALGQKTAVINVNDFSLIFIFQNLSGMITERRYFFREGEGISRMDRNNLKVTDQQEVQRRASLGQQQPSRKLTSGIQRSSSTQSMVFKEEGTQLETFQSLTFRPEHSREFGTLQDFCSASYNPQLPQYGQGNTQTEIQAQAEVFSLQQTSTLLS